ncbi:DUF6475 domain-containing protein [Fastidiosibacter lacustris]|uniref:DUF6475 domain-containing protein n=1 Tax=Fastidiosibacter lacustris TaxID=2056695 RepID=UPI000E354B22|nr:DUF6475 domain-containing protein [Fastidiosibacter lacustris]
MLDKNIFSSWFTFIENQYGQKDQSFKEIYFEMLNDIETGDFKAGVKKLLSQRVYNSFPTIAEIRNACLVDVDSRAIMAWQAVYDAISRYGAYGTVAFGDKVIHMALEAVGGWHRLCTSTIQQLEFLKKDFAKAYVSYSFTPMETKPYFAGICDQQNGSVMINRIGCNYLSESESNKQLAYVAGNKGSAKQIMAEIKNKIAFKEVQGGAA